MAGLMAMIIAPPTPCSARKMTRMQQGRSRPAESGAEGKDDESQHPEEFLPHHIQQSAQDQQEAGNDDEVGDDDPFHHAT